MFKNRHWEVKRVKDKKEKFTDPIAPKQPDDFETKAEFVLRKLEGIGVKVLIGVGSYIVLDTIRQVAVEKSKKN